MKNIDEIGDIVWKRDCFGNYKKREGLLERTEMRMLRYIVYF